MYNTFSFHSSVV